MSLLVEIRQRLQALSSRERIMATGCTVVLLVYGLYMLLWQPLQDEQAQLQQAIKVKRETYQYLQQMAERVTGLGGSSPPVTVDPSQQEVILRQSAMQLGLAETIKQLRAGPANQFELTLEKTPFDSLIKWLAALADKHGAQVLQLRLGEAGPGLVDGRLRLGF